MFTTILAAANKAAGSSETGEVSNSAWMFIKRNFINFEFFSSHVEVDIHYGTVAMIGLLALIWISRKISRRPTS